MQAVFNAYNFVHRTLLLDAESTMLEVNGRAGGKLHFDCTRGLGLCGSYVKGDKDGVQVTSKVDGRKERSVIYELSFPHGAL